MSAVTADQLRAALAVTLPLVLGLSLAQTAETIGKTPALVGAREGNFAFWAGANALSGKLTSFSQYFVLTVFENVSNCFICKKLIGMLIAFIFIEIFSINQYKVKNT